MACSNTLPPAVSFNCEDIKMPIYKFTFENGKCFKDGELFGNVIFSDEKYVQVECNDGGFADGKILIFASM